MEQDLNNLNGLGWTMVEPAKFREVAAISKSRRIRLGEVLEYRGIAREQIYDLLAPFLFDPNPHKSANSRSEFMVPYTDLIRISGASGSVIRAIRQGEHKRITLATFPALAGLLLACHVLAQNPKTGWAGRFGYPFRLLTRFMRSLTDQTVIGGAEMLGPRTGPAKYFYFQLSMDFWDDNDFWTNWKQKLNDYLRADLSYKVIEIDPTVASALKTRGQIMLVQIPVRTRLFRVVAPTVLAFATSHAEAVDEARARAALLDASDVAFLLSPWSESYQAENEGQDSIYGVNMERNGVWGLGFRTEHLLGPRALSAPHLTVRWKMDYAALKLAQNRGS